MSSYYGCLGIEIPCIFKKMGAWIMVDVGMLQIKFVDETSQMLRHYVTVLNQGDIGFTSAKTRLADY